MVHLTRSFPSVLLSCWKTIRVRSAAGGYQTTDERFVIIRRRCLRLHSARLVKVASSLNRNSVRLHRRFLLRFQARFRGV